MVADLSVAQARRIALAAQGFADHQPRGTPDIRHLRRVLARTGLLQIDSVNVLRRAHYLPMFSRLGAYPTTLLDRAAYRRPAELFEYWGHEASLIPVVTQPALRWRMAAAADHAWGGMRRVAREQPELVAWVLDEVRDKGPLTAAEIEHDVPRVAGNWGWNWSAVKQALEWLFWSGRVGVADRTNSFARRYDLPERILPAAVLAAPTPPVGEAMRTLVGTAARALGVATEADLRDYFRLPTAAARAAVRELVEAGTLAPVQVAGWQPPAYLYVAARAPRTVPASALVSPFDPLIWERARTERLFGFRYRIEIYVPAAKRRHGYYVLPFLHDERLVARVDLKADRRASLLRVPAAWIEPGEDPGSTAAALAAALRRLADWLGLGAIVAPEAGDLAPTLTAALR
ncbi:winged helix-turn-helix domain-containing protein [Pilimelia columellifera]|uniref:Winged helix-turn-helix domain-containing protein n=1 Tax=Pilimelia columellifera subsp. columellifera TaxID=706583 RepID=A0ABP6AHB7_9ACTN